MLPITDSHFYDWLHDLARCLANKGSTLYDIHDLAVYRRRFLQGAEPEDVAHEILAQRDPCLDDF